MINESEIVELSTWPAAIEEFLYIISLIAFIFAQPKYFLYLVKIFSGWDSSHVETGYKKLGKSWSTFAEIWRVSRVFEIKSIHPNRVGSSNIKFN